MPQFVLIAYDSKEEGAYERRVRIRASHVESNTRLRKEGKILMGVAITDDNGKMIGSVVITNFPSRAEFDDWLMHEPYMMGKVWDSNNITVLGADVSPSFTDLVK
jgi:uncharacterized protein